MKVRCIKEKKGLTVGKIYEVSNDLEGYCYIKHDDGIFKLVLGVSDILPDWLEEVESPMTYEELERLHKKVSEASTIKIGSLCNRLTFRFDLDATCRFEIRDKLLSKEELLDLKKITEQLFPGE